MYWEIWSLVAGRRGTFCATIWMAGSLALGLGEGKDERVLRLFDLGGMTDDAIPFTLYIITTERQLATTKILLILRSVVAQTRVWYDRSRKMRRAEPLRSCVYRPLSRMNPSQHDLPDISACTTRASATEVARECWLPFAAAVSTVQQCLRGQRVATGCEKSY